VYLELSIEIRLQMKRVTANQEAPCSFPRHYVTCPCHLFLFTVIDKSSPILVLHSLNRWNFPSDILEAYDPRSRLSVLT
jgi:hypothetical protein